MAPIACLLLKTPLETTLVMVMTLKLTITVMMPSQTPQIRRAKALPFLKEKM